MPLHKKWYIFNNLIFSMATNSVFLLNFNEILTVSMNTMFILFKGNQKCLLLMLIKKNINKRN